MNLLDLTRRRLAALLAVTSGVLALLVGAGVPPAAAVDLSPVSGSGSSYVGIAMRQWVAQGQAQGWSVRYQSVGSPTGMGFYAGNQVDYAGTEAEFSSLGTPDANVGRGFQYVPDVAGGTAIMYNLTDASGRKVDYLHLDRKTVARIYMGTITRWSDPAISATNKGIKFPDQAIKVVLRGNQSGTTALFYDFIANTLGSEFTSRWNAAGCPSADVRPVIISCRTSTSLIPNNVSFNDSDQIAQFVAGSTGKWSIGFDEFGYAKVYKASSAWIQNASGGYVLPYAQNISAALESAKLRADLSQDLSQVYASRTAGAYPISAYSYMVTQCATGSSRATCKGPYTDAGKGATLAKWMRYIACDGQVSMAAQGYSPLPTNLSQEMANSVGRLTGAAAEKLTASNCNNPRFKGSLGAGSTSPCDPFLSTCRTTTTSTGGKVSGSSAPVAGAKAGTAGTKAGAAGTVAGAAAGAGAVAGAAAAGGGAVAAGTGTVAGSSVAAVGGGSDPANWRNASPTAFDAVIPDDPFGSLPAILVFAAATLPALVGMAARDRRRKAEADT